MRIRKSRYWVEETVERWLEKTRIMEKVSGEKVEKAYAEAKLLIVNNKIDKILKRLKPKNEERSLKRLTELLVEKNRLKKE